jgi:hypothetical protein
MTFRQQGIAQVRAEKPCAAGDEDELASPVLHKAFLQLQSPAPIAD